jgi:hypothetical protein
MAPNGNWQGGVGGGYVTQDQFKELVTGVQQMVANIGRDIKAQIEQQNKLTKAHNSLREELGTAQNVTAELVDALSLHLEFLMEKGSYAKDGQVGDEFKQWCSARIANNEELKQKAKDAGIWSEPPAPLVDPTAN